MFRLSKQFPLSPLCRAFRNRPISFFFPGAYVSHRQRLCLFLCQLRLLFYFVNYGHTLTILGNFRDIVGENSFTLTNISQFLPLVHSYMSFWGLDQAYQIQAFLTLNISLPPFSCVLRQCTLEIPLRRTKRPFICRALYPAAGFLHVVSRSLQLGAGQYVLYDLYFLSLSAFLIGTVLPGRGTEKRGEAGQPFADRHFSLALALLRKRRHHLCRLFPDLLLQY